MQPWAYSDLFVFIFSGLLQLLVRRGPIDVLLLVLGAAPFFLVRLPVRTFINFYCTSWERKLPFARRASTFEYICVQSLRWMLEKLNVDSIGRRIFMSQGACTFTFALRKFRYGIDKVGDSFYEPVNVSLFQGYWVKSKSRVKSGAHHDIAVLMAPGNLMGFTSSYAYLEFLMTLNYTLIEQGFKNPAIFCLDINWSRGFTNEVSNLGMAWHYFQTQTPGAIQIIMGDGAGATGVLSCLLHIAKPLNGLTKLEDPRPPAGAILVSPLAKISKKRVTNANDYVTRTSLDKFCLRVIESEEATKLHTMPGVMFGEQWWPAALPKLGTFIFYGLEETCAPEIEEMYERIKPYGRVQLVAEANHVHAWPLLASFAGHTENARISGIEKIADKIACMALWECANGGLASAPGAAQPEATPGITPGGATPGTTPLPAAATPGTTPLATPA